MSGRARRHAGQPAGPLYAPEAAARAQLAARLMAEGKDYVAALEESAKAAPAGPVAVPTAGGVTMAPSARSAR